VSFLRLYTHSDGLDDFQLQHLSLSKANAKNNSEFVQNTKQGAYLFIDRFRRCSFVESLILIGRDGRLFAIHEHLGSQESLDVSYGVFGKRCRLWMTQLVRGQVLVSYIANCPDPR
jgi:hypothetical protein